MKIAIDAHFVGVRHGGNEVHFENLIRHLARMASGGDEYFVFTYQCAARSRLDEQRLTFIPLRSRSVLWQRAVEIPRHTHRLDVDLLHVPFNYLPAHRCRKVVTIHDLGFLRFPETYAALERARMAWLTRFAARHADHVFTGSHAAKAEIMAEYHIDESRVSVTPSAADQASFRPLAPDEITSFRKRRGLPFPYILFVGTIQPRKNVVALLRAFHRLRSRRYEHRLVLVGRRGWRADAVFQFITEHGLSDVVHHFDDVDVAELPRFYNAATLFAYPSLYEGFGMPILEAMSCGCPVVSANTSSLPEVYGDAALTFDPHDAEALAERMIEVVEDGELRAQLQRRGFVNCSRFSWARTADVVHTVYHTL